MKQLIILLAGMLLSISTTFSQSGLIIFLDHSSSMVSASEFSDKENRTIKQLLTSHLKKNGDFVVISFLFSNTASISNRKEYTFRFKPMTTKGLSGKALQLRKVNNELRERRYKAALIERITRDMKVTDPKANRSEILESLVQVNRTIPKASKLQIVYISDMEEASTYRVFNEITSVSKAIEYAKKDVQKLISDYHLPSSISKPITIKCYFASNTLDNRNSLRFVEAYWKQIFGTFFKNANVQFLNF